MLQNAGFVPEEMSVLQEIGALRAKLDACSDEAERQALGSPSPLLPCRSPRRE